MSDRIFQARSVGRARLTTVALDYRSRMADRLLVIIGVLFAVTGIGYLLVPGTMLGIVGIASAATSDFLIDRGRRPALRRRCHLGARQAQPAGLRLVLLSLAAYLVLGALVDVAAFV